MFVSATKKKRIVKEIYFCIFTNDASLFESVRIFPSVSRNIFIFPKWEFTWNRRSAIHRYFFFFNNLHFDHVLRSTPHVWKYSIELSIFARTLNVCPTTLHTLANPALIYDGQEALKIIQSSVHGRPRDLVETHLYSSFRVYSDFSNFRFGFSSSFLPLLCPLYPPETETPDDAAH